MTAFFNQTDPVLLAALGVIAIALMLVIVLLVRRSGTTTDPDLLKALENLGEAQSDLENRLKYMDEQRVQSEALLKDTLDKRLDSVSLQLNSGLREQTERTQQTLTGFTERLAVIDEAQKNLTELSGHVIDLQKVLDNKQARGAFGEVQLHDLVTKMLPPNAYKFQAKLSTNAQPDCLIDLPNPPGPIVVDSKFPFEAYTALLNADDEDSRTKALRRFRDDVKKHISDIASKYIIPGETTDSAIMFVPFESLYSEIHTSLPAVVDESHSKRVWITSPTTMMALLHTIRAVLKDAEIKEQAHLIQKEVNLLSEDARRLGERVKKLGTHFRQAQDDVEKITTSTDGIQRHANRIKNIELEDHSKDDPDDQILPFDPD